MVFFLPLRQSTTTPGTIEPDIFPTTSSSTQMFSSNTGPIALKSPLPSFETSAYTEYITRWDLSDRPALSRKVVCVLAVLLHVPQNVISIWSHGISVILVVYLLLSVLNLVCVAIAMWRLDVMRGERLVYNKIYKRHNFDYVILALFFIYGLSAAVFIFGKMKFESWVWVFRIGWPCLVVTDLFCFIVGWIATWRDVSDPFLG